MKIRLNLKRDYFNAYYLPYLYDYEHRFDVWYGGAGSGKSVFIAQKLLIKALRSRRKILVMRKIGSTLRDSVWQNIRNIVEEFHITDYCTVNKSEFTIELPNGSLFLFKGMDDPEKIKSITDITDIWVEEATEFTEEDVDQLNLRLRARADNLQMFFSFNPVSKANWVYKRWFSSADNKSTNPLGCSTYRPTDGTDTVIHKTTYKDNNFLPESYIQAIEKLKETNPAYYAIYANGEFASLDKLVFSSFNSFKIDITTIKDWSLLCGLDFGYTNDPTAFVVAFLNEEEKKIYIDKEFVKTGMLNNEIAAAIRSLGFAKSVIIADSAEQKSIEEIRRAGITRIYPATKGQGSILQGIQRLQQYKLIVNPDCTNVITELQNYAWKKDHKTGEYINVPVDDFNHCIDALRYSLQCMDKYKRMTTLNKSVLGL